MLEEKLLKNWVLLSRIIKNDRFVDKIPYSEVLILSLLFPFFPHYVSIKEIIADTKMLKSQVNRTIASLLRKEYIVKRSCMQDKRCLEICLTKKGNQFMKEIHTNSLQICKKFIQVIGEEDAITLNRIFEKIITNQEK